MKIYNRALVALIGFACSSVVIHGATTNSKTNQQAFEKLVNVKISLFKGSSEQQKKDLQTLAALIVIYAAKQMTEKSPTYEHVYKNINTLFSPLIFDKNRDVQKAFAYIIAKSYNETDLTTIMNALQPDYRNIINALNTLKINHDFPPYLETNMIENLPNSLANDFFYSFSVITPEIEEFLDDVGTSIDAIDSDPKTEPLALELEKLATQLASITNNIIEFAIQYKESNSDLDKIKIFLNAKSLKPQFLETKNKIFTLLNNPSIQIKVKRIDRSKIEEKLKKIGIVTKI